MRREWLSPSPSAWLPKIGQHTRVPVSYCPYWFSSLSIPAKRPKQPWQKGRDLLLVCQALAKEEGPLPCLPSTGRRGPPPRLHLFRQFGWNGRGGKSAQAVRNRISKCAGQFRVSRQKGRVIATSASSWATSELEEVESQLSSLH